MSQSSNRKGFGRREFLAALAVGGGGIIAWNLIGKPDSDTAASEFAGPSSGGLDRIIVGLSQEPTVFNPLMVHNETDDGVLFSVFDPLVRMDPDGYLQPQLAREVPSLENGGISAGTTADLSPPKTSNSRWN